MTTKQKARLLEGLSIRQLQLTTAIQGFELKYPLHSGHHLRDVMTVIEVLKGGENANKLLENLPTNDYIPDRRDGQ